MGLKRTSFNRLSLAKFSSVVTGTGAGTGTGTGPTSSVTISSIQIANSSFVAKDDLAVDTAGGYMIVNGTGFQSGAVVYIQGTAATSTAFVSASRLNVTVQSLSSGLLDVYVVNPDNSGAINIRSLSANGVPSWTTTSPLSSKEADTAFSINLVATGAAGDGTITYAVSSGSSLPSGTTLASNGYFSGTVTNLSQETTFSFSVDAIDAQLQETVRTFSITFTVGDTNFKDTVLLLNGETSNNTWITDASTNGFAITVSGDTRPMAFSPYKTVWSNSFDGTGDYLTLPSDAAFAFGTGDFTVEGWYYLNAGVTRFCLYDSGNGGSLGQFSIFQDSASGFFVRMTSDITYGSPPGTQAWNHFAVTRSGTTVRLFFNGTQAATGTQSTNITNTTPFIGYLNGFGTYIMNGYISNLRVLKGTALYTSNFTPSTSPLTAIANTSLLTCQSNRLRDASTNNFTITKNGDVTVSNFSPFAETDTTTASGYFDGLSDNIRKAGSGVLVANGDVTIECWMYPLSASITGIFDGGPSAVNIIRSYGTNKISKQGQEATGAAFTPIVNAWQHFAVTFSNGNIVTYINGVQSGTGTYTSGYDAGSNFDIGGINAGVDGNFNGYISNFRVVRALVYTGTFTPPTAPLTAIANTSLLTLQSRIGENNNRFIDTSGINNIITRNGNATQGTFSPFSQNGWSGYFTGSSTSYISTPSTTIGNQGQAYTVQCWIYPTVFQTSSSAVRRMYIFIKGVIYAGLSIHSDGTLGWYGWPTPGGIIVNSAAGTITTNAWQHVALVVNPGNYIKLFKNGVEVGNSAYTAAGADGSAIQIGNGDTGASGTDGFIGYISNFKITQSALTAGQLDYSSSPTISSNTGASLLTLQTNRFNDTSANNLTITTGGAPSVQAFSPFKPTSEWSLSTVGGSMYFDGTGDYLTIPSNTGFSFGTGDFTVEAWVYLTATQNFGPIFISSSTGAGDSLHVQINSANKVRITNASTQFLLATNAITLNTWTHVAVVRSGTTLSIYQDGVLNGSTTNSTSFTENAPTIGYEMVGGAYYFTGYISNLRVVKGTAVYTSAFTPPTAPATPVAGTTLLLNGTNAGIIDYTGRNNLETVGDAKLSYSVKKFGNTSISFDGTGDYVYIPTTVNYGYGTGDFTIEFWLNLNSTGLQTIFSHLSSNPQVKPHIYYSSGVRLYVNGGDVITGGTLTTGSWNHIALSRSSGSTKLFINGTQSGSTYTDSNNYGTTSPLIIGDYSVPPTGTNMLNGYIDDLRITKGVARYTSNFTVPSAPFPLK